MTTAIERSTYKGLTCWILVDVLANKIIGWSYDFKEINALFTKLN